MRSILALVFSLWASVALAQGCGPANPNCIVPTAPQNTNNNQAASTAFVQTAIGAGGSIVLPQNNIFVGNASNFAAGVALSGDCTIVAAGSITCTKTNGTAFGTAAAQNTGTSGANLPFLNGTNTWGGTQTFADAGTWGTSGISTTALAASGAVSGAGFTSLFASPPAIGGTAPAGGAFTTLSASSTVSGNGFSTYLASPPSIGGTAPAAGSFTTLNTTGTTTLGNTTAVHVITRQTTPPALSSCGTNPTIVGTDVAGTVTLGTGTPASCTITFNVAYVSTPFCVVSYRSQLTSRAYSVSNTAITLTQTATSSDVIDYICMAQAGG